MDHRGLYKRGPGLVQRVRVRGGRVPVSCCIGHSVWPWCVTFTCEVAYVHVAVCPHCECGVHECLCVCFMERLWWWCWCVHVPVRHCSTPTQDEGQRATGGVGCLCLNSTKI